MNYLLLSLALFAVAAIVSGMVLALRLYRKNAEFRAARERPARADSSSAFPEDTAAIDQILYDRCCRCMMERKPFLVDSFSLQDLASMLYTNKVYLSKTIRRFSGRNFKQYVNYYRVVYSMELFRNNMSLRVSELGNLSGFRTHTSYLRNFKEVTGEQPSQWCARMRRRRYKP